MFRRWMGDVKLVAGVRQLVWEERRWLQLNADCSGFSPVASSVTTPGFSGPQGLGVLVDSEFFQTRGAMIVKRAQLSFQHLDVRCDGGNVGGESTSYSVYGVWHGPRSLVATGLFPSGKSLFIKPGLFGVSQACSKGDSARMREYTIPLQDAVRGFAKTVAVPPQNQRPMKLKLYMGSPGVIGEPYKRPPAPLPFLKRWFSREGWTRKKQYFMGMVKTSYTIAKLRQKTKGYSQQRFYQEASDLYKQINLALAQGERTTLRQLVTDSVFSIMKNELKHRESSWAKVDWEIVGPISKLRTLQGRLIGVDKNNHDNAFVQLTVGILSKQKFAAYDKSGKLVAGNPEKELLVEDIWVFEKPLLLSEAKWRLCARLSV